MKTDMVQNPSAIQLPGNRVIILLLEYNTSSSVKKSSPFLSVTL